MVKELSEKSKEAIKDLIGIIANEEYLNKVMDAYVIPTKESNKEFLDNLSSILNQTIEYVEDYSFELYIDYASRLYILIKDKKHE